MVYFWLACLAYVYILIGRFLTSCSLWQIGDVYLRNDYDTPAWIEWSITLLWPAVIAIWVYFTMMLALIRATKTIIVFLWQVNLKLVAGAYKLGDYLRQDAQQDQLRREAEQIQEAGRRQRRGK